MKQQAICVGKDNFWSVYKKKERIGHWDLFCRTRKHSSSLTDAEAYGRPKQQPSFLKSDVFPLSLLLGIALSLKLRSEMTTNQQWIGSYGATLVTQPSKRVLKSHFTTLPVIPGPFRLTFYFVTVKTHDYISKVYFFFLFFLFFLSPCESQEVAGSEHSGLRILMRDS